jgi:hypothetical protein
MTVATMHSEFKIGLDKVDSLSHPNFLPEEIDVLLNQAQDKFIKQRSYGNNPRRIGLEETQKRLDDIKNLITNFESTTFVTNTDNKPNGAFVAIPSDYMFAIEEEATITYLDCNGDSATKRVDVIPTTHDRYNKVKRDPFHRPDNSEVHRLGYTKISGSENFELITGSGNTVSNYYLRYLKEPVVIQYGTQYSTPIADVDCDLSEHTHREIIAIAVKDALEDIESPRYPTNKNELKEIE